MMADADGTVMRGALRLLNITPDDMQSLPAGAYAVRRGAAP